MVLSSTRAFRIVGHGTRRVLSLQGLRPRTTIVFGHLGLKMAGKVSKIIPLNRRYLEMIVEQAFGAERVSSAPKEMIKRPLKH
jgi:hypothetical protein